VDLANDEIAVPNSGANSITVHTRTASGDTAPLRTISGGSTLMNNPAAVDVDNVNNELAVANAASNSITIFSRTASGDTAPLRTIAGAATGLNVPQDIVILP
jgi:6-phosphogluconolactonase (cycloisomerase 2 family)